AAHLFDPRPAYRFRSTADGHETPEGSDVIGQNPPYGADLDFWLADATADSVTLRITDADGDTVRTLHAQGKAGINRVWWDLRYESARKVHFLRPPPDAPWADPRREYSAYGIDAPEPGPIVVPGTYTVTLSAAGHEETGTLQVKADPGSQGTPSSIQAQVSFLLGVRAEIDSVADMIDHIERTRRQVEDLVPLLRERGGEDTSLVASAHALERKAVAVESRLIDVRTTGRSEDIFWHSMKLYGRLQWMITEMDGRAGGGSGGADRGPTDQQKAVNEQFRKEIADVRGDFQALVGQATPAFDAELAKAGLKASIEP
ncbi:MAG TPA: hypothetical protein VKA44_03565, partial [Gemmatimonadota bacterium]|nr:hypothetical protein [Gemmatimonadota bacterium]